MLNCFLWSARFFWQWAHCVIVVILYNNYYVIWFIIVLWKELWCYNWASEKKTGCEYLILQWNVMWLQSRGTGWCLGSTCFHTIVSSHCLRNISFHDGCKYLARGCLDRIATTTKWRAGTRAGRLCFHSSCCLIVQLKVLLTYICV